MAEPTIRQVAQRAQVSLGTVSNYLNDTKPLAEGTRSRIAAAIADLGFVPNTAVRIMRGGRSHAIALIVPDGGNPVFHEIARGIEDVAIEHRHVVIVCSTEGDRTRETTYAEVFAETRVRAVVAVASAAGASGLEPVRTTGGRVVVLGAGADPRDDSVASDDVEGGRLAMAHALGLGHRRITYFGGPGAQPQLEARLRGAREALEAAGLSDLGLTRIDAADATTRGRVAAADTILDDSPRSTAVICGNDLLAAALETAALRRGIRVPDELSIIGYDDSEAAAGALVPLTTVAVPHREMGRAAARFALSDEPAGGRSARFEPRLVQRHSTSAPASGGAAVRERV